MTECVFSNGGNRGLVQKTGIGIATPLAEMQLGPTKNMPVDHGMIEQHSDLKWLTTVDGF